MGKIVILDEYTANKIAAGEVVERPASIVKELCENSIDAGATSITVEIKKGGISYIKIIDNGSGIGKDDVQIAFEKHATSKIRKADDLVSISSMGFRGEALASIGAVSKVELITKTVEDMEGSKIEVEGGNIGEREAIGSPIGTSITVKNLFFNTPARYKFLKKDYTEAGYIEDVITRLALGNPKISFKLINSGKIILQTPGNNDLLLCAYSIFGNDAKSMIKVNYEEQGIKISGLVGKPEISRSNRTRQIFFINNRYIKNKTLTAAVEGAYKTLIQVGKYPFVILNISLNPELVDVNVHPTKQEVRFSDESQIFNIVYYAVKNALLGGESLIPEFEKRLEKDNLFSEFKENKTAYQSNELNNKNKGVAKTFSGGLELKNNGNNYNNENIKQDNFFSHTFKAKEEPEFNSKSIYNTSIFVKDKEQEDKDMLFKILGTAFSTYIIVELNNELFIIDQHAAHERVMYEKLKKEWEKGSELSQLLLVPEIVELTHKEMQIIQENNKMLSKIGFSIEPFGNNAVKINSVPLMCEKVGIKSLLIDLVDHFEEFVKNKDNLTEEKLLHRVACKSAVKANANLSKEEISSLIKSMQGLENPYTCPHGRPTIIKMTKHELEKKFGRT